MPHSSYNSRIHRINPTTNESALFEAIESLNNTSRFIFVYKNIGEASYMSYLYEKIYQKPSHTLDSINAHQENIYKMQHSDIAMYVGSLSKALSDNSPIFTSVDCLLFKCLNADILNSHKIEIKQGSTLDKIDLEDALSQYGYKRSSNIDGMGSYSSMGLSLDIHAATNKDIYRIIFDGDTVESISIIDKSTKESKENIDHCSIFYCKLNITESAKSKQADPAEDNDLCLMDLFNSKDAFIYDEGIEGTLMSTMQSNLDNLDSDNFMHAHDYSVDSALKLLGHVDYNFVLYNIHSGYNRNRQGPAQSKTCFYSIEELGDFVNNTSKKILVAIQDESVKSTFFQKLYKFTNKKGDIFKSLEATLESSWDIFLIDMRLTDIIETINFVVVPFGASSKFIAPDKGPKPHDQDSLYKFAPGDYVQHQEYGIGVFKGTNSINIHGKNSTMIKVMYRNQRILYMPIEDSYLLEPYRASRRPALSKLIYKI